jgi:hypothetical protein
MARYPAGYGDEPPPDFLGRRSWHLIYTCGVRPKAGELWRFPVNATPGSFRTEDKRWVEVFKGGQFRHLWTLHTELQSKWLYKEITIREVLSGFYGTLVVLRYEYHSPSLR